jgi:drug/metabolite transporter (DMT)-like permease
MKDAASERRQRLIGIALMCGAVACFACLDATAKYLNPHIGTIMVVWARYTSAFLLALLVSNPVTRPGLVRTSRPLLQIGRAALLFLSTALNFLALRFLQLDQAMAITFSTPFFVAILAGPLLGEWIGWQRWIAIGAGFLGVLLVARPGAGGIHPAALFSLGGAICYAFYAISTRLLARSDSNATTLFYSNLIGAAAMLPFVPLFWTAPREPLVAVLMVSTGFWGGLGHYLLIAGHRLAPAAVLSPFIYTQLIWAMTLGYIVFADVPNRFTLAGAGIVVASGLYNLHRERVGG